MTPPFGCTNDTTLNITNGYALRDRVAVFYRGVCTFSMMMAGARQYGAMAVLIISQEDHEMVMLLAPTYLHAPRHSMGGVELLTL